LFTAVGFMILPLVGGLFMIILKDPERARALGLVSMKAQLFTAGVADWPTFFDILLQGMAIGGSIVFALITAWIFGREFADHTVKELLALPTPRSAIVGAKFVLVTLWCMGLALVIFLVGLAIGAAVHIPGWSPALGWSSFAFLMITAFVTCLLMPFVALFAGVGRGYLAPLGWALLMLALSQIVTVLGWGDRFPWSVPVLFSGMAGPRAEQIGAHSYVLVLLAFVVGVVATFAWWQRADQAR
ncbi:MAG: ABC transporter permease, partial [Fidelibacterota bacterium]